MAVGVTQPGGAGTTIMFQTDSSAPNGLYYRNQDFSAAFPADFVDLGTTPKSYRCKVDLQNGDGALTATTTWKDTRSTVYFDTGKTYITHLTGEANRFVEFGTLGTGADGSLVGTDGLNVYFGITPKMSSGLAQMGGNHKFYGSLLVNVNAVANSSRLNFAPVVGGYSEFIDVTVFTSGGFQAYGNTAGSTINRMRRLNSTSTASGAINGHLVQFNCPDADDITFYWPNGDAKIFTAGYVVIGNPHFIGPSTLGDTRSILAMILLNPQWSQNTTKNASGSSPFLEEWFTFGVLVTDANGAPVSGIRIEVYDNFDGRTVVDTTTGALGTTDFLPLQSVAESPPFISGHETAPFRNALMVNGHNNDGVMHDHSPFTLFVNRGQGVGLYPEYVQKFSFPYSTYLAGAEKQWSPMYFNVVLPDSGTGIATNWVELAL